MIAAVQEKCAREEINNVLAEERDFVAQRTGLPDNFADAALRFNILHVKEPVSLLGEAFRILAPGAV